MRLNNHVGLPSSTRLPSPAGLRLPSDEGLSTMQNSLGLPGFLGVRCSRVLPGSPGTRDSLSLPCSSPMRSSRSLEAGLPLPSPDPAKSAGRSPWAAEELPRSLSVPSPGFLLRSPQVHASCRVLQSRKEDEAPRKLSSAVVKVHPGSLFLPYSELPLPGKP